MSIIDTIHQREDLLRISKDDIPALCEEIRQFLLEKVSRTGGHLASNLGAVELTVAIHRVYDPMRDRILFDVGHQSYVHKMFTGRMEGFDTLRELDGLSGFPKPCESEADPFVAGHASDAISLGLGIARARTLQKKDYDVCVVVGDGAMTGGLSFEGLGDAGTGGEPMVIVLNDNGMAIKENVGGFAALLSRARLRPGYIHFKQQYRKLTEKTPALYQATHRLKEMIRNRLIPPGMFDDMGFYYIGPVDGHNEAELEETIRWARDLREPVVIHAVTVKGKGYPPAELHPDLYHGVGPFDPGVGVKISRKETFSEAFGKAIVELGEEDPAVCAVTAAMEDGTGLEKFAQTFPERYFELGIVEEHAVAMCAGMAKQGMKPVFAVYSTFLQRSYDMLIENVGIMKNHVVFAVDRAGLVGHDGVSHQGSFDVAYLSTVPGMRIYAPSSHRELRSMLRRAVLELDGPVAVRYPRGSEGAYTGDHSGEDALVLREGKDATIVCHGIPVNEAIGAAEELEKENISVELVKLNCLQPLPADIPLASMEKTGRVIFVEDDCRAGSVGTRLLAEGCLRGIRLRAVRQLDLGSGVVDHGSVSQLYHRLNMDRDGICRTVREILYEENKTGSAGL